MTPPYILISAVGADAHISPQYNKKWTPDWESILF